MLRYDWDGTKEFSELLDTAVSCAGASHLNINKFMGLLFSLSLCLPVAFAVENKVHDVVENLKICNAPLMLLIRLENILLKHAL